MKKEIKYDNRTFFYEIISGECGEYGATVCYRTDFFIPNGTGKYKKYWLFGPEVSYAKYKKVFSIHENIENPTLSKSEVKEKLKKEIKLYDRAEEIKNGEII